MTYVEMKQRLRDAGLQYPLPKVFNKDEYIKFGVIAKANLQDGCYYYGLCRNAVVAKWIAAKQCFVYMRTKFTFRFPEDIFHMEDDNGFDLFLPLEKTDEANLNEEEKIK